MTDYRGVFESNADAERYDEIEYGAGTYSSLMSSIESTIIDEMLIGRGARLRTLDFACGTGRVSRMLPPQCEPVTGVDINGSMIERAQAADPEGTYIAGDIHELGSSLGAFDLIVAFRFILNASDDTRKQCLQELRSSCAHQQTLLLVNNHGNRWSHKVVSHVLDRTGIRRAGNTGNTMSHGEVVELLAATGFKILDRRGYGFIGGKLYSRLNTARWDRRERALHKRFGRRWVGHLGGHQLYIAVVSEEPLRVADRRL